MRQKRGVFPGVLQAAHGGGSWAGRSAGPGQRRSPCVQTLGPPKGELLRKENRLQGGQARACVSNPGSEVRGRAQPTFSHLPPHAVGTGQNLGRLGSLALLWPLLPSSRPLPPATAQLRPPGEAWRRLFPYAPRGSLEGQAGKLAAVGGGSRRSAPAPCPGLARHLPLSRDLPPLRLSSHPPSPAVCTKQPPHSVASKSKDKLRSRWSRVRRRQASLAGPHCRDLECLVPAINNDSEGSNLLDEESTVHPQGKVMGQRWGRGWGGGEGSSPRHRTRTREDETSTNAPPANCGHRDGVGHRSARKLKLSGWTFGG